jgi:sigma-B regulation protein RsbU (phosphoserine phosphatase)
MEIISQLNLFSFIPAVVFSIVLWSDIKNKAQFGARPRYLLFSIMLLVIIGALLLQYRLDAGFWRPGLSFSLFSTLFALYLFMFFMLEYSIHCQRIIKSHVWNDFSKNLKKTIFYWITLALIIACSYVVFFLYDTGMEAGTAGELNTPVIVLCVLFTLVSVLLIDRYRRSVFRLQAGVIRTNNFTFNISLVVLMAGALYFLFMDGAQRPLYTEVFLLLTLAYIIRVYMEYFYQRTLNLERTIDKQEQSTDLLNELVSREASSPIEEDVEILKSTIAEELSHLKESLPQAEYAFSGFMLYSLEKNVLKVISPQLISGFCTPLHKFSTVKLLKNKQQIEESILNTTYDLNKISSMPLQDLTDWGAQIIKQMLTTRERIVIDQIPDELKGLQRLIVVSPIFDKDMLIGVFVAFKDSFDKLFPEEENTLAWLCGNLKIILTIISGKRIQHERNRLSNELNIAKNIQTSILPTEVDIPGFETATNMVTATEVGGDVYDYMRTEAGTYLGIGDVSGHGLPAGIMALIQLVAFEAVVMATQTLKKQIQPYEIYNIVNKLLCTINRDRIGSDKFMTQNYFFVKNGTFTHAGAHEIALLYRKKQRDVVELNDLAKKAAFMGITELATAQNSSGSFKLNKSDVLLLYTDGAIQARDDGGNQFGIEKLKKVLAKHQALPLKQLIEVIMREIQDHAQNGDLKKYNGNFADDVSLFVLRKT